MIRSISEMFRNFVNEGEGEQEIEKGLLEMERKETCHLAKSNIDKYLETGDKQYLDSALFLLQDIRGE